MLLTCLLTDFPSVDLYPRLLDSGLLITAFYENGTPFEGPVYVLGYNETDYFLGCYGLPGGEALITDPDLLEFKNSGRIEILVLPKCLLEDGGWEGMLPQRLGSVSPPTCPTDLPEEVYPMVYQVVMPSSPPGFIFPPDYCLPVGFLLSLLFSGAFFSGATPFGVFNLSGFRFRSSITWSPQRKIVYSPGTLFFNVGEFATMAMQKYEEQKKGEEEEEGGNNSTTAESQSLGGVEMAAKATGVAGTGPSKGLLSLIGKRTKATATNLGKGIVKKVVEEGRRQSLKQAVERLQPGFQQAKTSFFTFLQHPDEMVVATGKALKEMLAIPAEVLAMEEKDGKMVKKRPEWLGYTVLVVATLLPFITQWLRTKKGLRFERNEALKGVKDYFLSPGFYEALYQLTQQGRSGMIEAQEIFAERLLRDGFPLFLAGSLESLEEEIKPADNAPENLRKAWAKFKKLPALDRLWVYHLVVNPPVPPEKGLGAVMQSRILLRPLKERLQAVGLEMEEATVLAKHLAGKNEVLKSGLEGSDLLSTTSKTIEFFGEKPSPYQDEVFTWVAAQISVQKRMGMTPNTPRASLLDHLELLTRNPNIDWNELQEELGDRETSIDDLLQEMKKQLEAAGDTPEVRRTIDLITDVQIELRQLGLNGITGKGLQVIPKVKRTVMESSYEKVKASVIFLRDFERLQKRMRAMSPSKWFKSKPLTLREYLDMAEARAKQDPRSFGNLVPLIQKVRSEAAELGVLDLQGRNVSNLRATVRRQVVENHWENFVVVVHGLVPPASMRQVQGEEGRPSYQYVIPILGNSGVPGRLIQRWKKEAEAEVSKEAHKTIRPLLKPSWVRSGEAELPKVGEVNVFFEIPSGKSLREKIIKWFTTTWRLGKFGISLPKEEERLPLDRAPPG